MIRLSESAADLMRNTLVGSRLGSGKTFRLSEERGGFALEIGTLGTNDRIVHYKGTPILLVALQLEEKIGDALIEVDCNSDSPSLSMLLVEWEGRVRQDIWSLEILSSGSSRDCQSGNGEQ